MNILAGLVQTEYPRNKDLAAYSQRNTNGQTNETMP